MADTPVVPVRADAYVSSDPVAVEPIIPQPLPTQTQKPVSIPTIPSQPASEPQYMKDFASLKQTVSVLPSGETPEQIHAEEEANPKNWWQKLDMFLWGRGQEVLALVLIVAVLFYTVVSAIQLSKTTRLEKNIGVLNSKMDKASELVTTWGGNSAKAVSFLEAQDKTNDILKRQMAVALQTIAATTEGTLAMQKGVADIANGVNDLLASSQENAAVANDTAIKLADLANGIDKVGITVVVNKEMPKAVAKPPAAPAKAESAQKTNAKEPVTAMTPATKKLRHWWALWLF